MNKERMLEIWKEQKEQVERFKKCAKESISLAKWILWEWERSIKINMILTILAYLNGILLGIFIVRLLQ